MNIMDSDEKYINVNLPLQASKIIEEPIQEQRPVYYSTDPGKENSPELMLRIVSGKNIINDVRCAMKGLEFDENTGKYMEIGKPMVSDECVDDMMGFLHHFINQNNIMSNLDEDYIRRVMPELNMDINGMFAIKWKDYGIEKYQYPFITKSISNMIFAALMRAVNMTTLRFLKSTESHHYTYTQQEEAKKEPNALSKFLHLGGK